MSHREPASRTIAPISRVLSRRFRGLRIAPRAATAKRAALGTIGIKCCTPKGFDKMDRAGIPEW